jgi:hypothetical protein
MIVTYTPQTSDFRSFSCHYLLQSAAFQRHALIAPHHQRFLFRNIIFLTMSRLLCYFDSALHFVVSFLNVCRLTTPLSFFSFHHLKNARLRRIFACYLSFSLLTCT